MRKTLMSVVAAATILGTGAQAFDTNNNGDILTRAATPGNYVGGVLPAAPLALSTNATGDRLKGDALIFPAFDMQGDWGTEVIFRNELSANGVVAKVVLYAADDSRELIDFNVYLSGDDQFRFTIQDGVVKSTDGSVVVSESFQNNSVVFASEQSPFEVAVLDPITQRTVETGYAIVYGMMQTATPYHLNHEGLFTAYRDALDTNRDGWRTNHMYLGVYDDDTATVAPNLLDTNVDALDVSPIALSGTERMYNAAGETRDLLLNPTPLANYTAGSVVIWAPGEYAAIADRNIFQDVNATQSIYNAAGVIVDNDAFVVNDTTYVFNNAEGNVDNRFLITQPTKRFMVQLGQGNQFWVQTCEDTSQDAQNGIITGLEWGFRGELNIFDEDENRYTSAINGGIITSPSSSAGQGGANCNELTTLGSADLEGQASEEFSGGNGFIKYNMTTGIRQGIPAIVTEMSANRVDGDGEINWVYAPATKILP